MSRELLIQHAVLTKEIAEARRKETELWDAKLPRLKTVFRDLGCPPGLNACCRFYLFVLTGAADCACAGEVPYTVLSKQWLQAMNEVTRLGHRQYQLRQSASPGEAAQTSGKVP